MVVATQNNKLEKRNKLPIVGHTSRIYTQNTIWGIIIELSPQNGKNLVHVFYIYITGYFVR